MEALIMSVFAQMPLVAVLALRTIAQDKRIDKLTDDIADCVKGRKMNDNDHTYTYPPK